LRPLGRANGGRRHDRLCARWAQTAEDFKIMALAAGHLAGQPRPL